MIWQWGGDAPFPPARPEPISGRHGAPVSYSATRFDPVTLIVPNASECASLNFYMPPSVTRLSEPRG